MKKVYILNLSVRLLLLVLTTGCSSHQANIEQHTGVEHVEQFEQDGAAYIYSPLDSFHVHSYYAIYSSSTHKYEAIHKPSDFFYEACWYTLDKYDIETPFDYEKHQLHVQKFTNKGYSYVVEGRALYINDSIRRYSKWFDPADSIQTFTMLGKSYTIITHIDPPPYQLMQVIEYYPEYVTVIDDTLEHSFNNIEASWERNYPHITIN